MDPKPSYVFPRLAVGLPCIDSLRLSRNNETQWQEYGYAVYFDLEHLEAQGTI